MSDIEELVRQSLRQRADDVEATPALWQEVDRRITRRRRLQVAVWSLAGATAAVLAILGVPALVAAPDPTPEVEPLPPGPEEGVDEPVEEPAPDDPAEADDPGDAIDDGGTSDTDTGSSAAPVQTEPVLVASGRTIDLIGEDGRVNVLEMDAEGESWIMGLAVRPGSSVDDYTAAVLTTAEGLWDLRHLHVVDGEVVTFEPFEPQHRPSLWLEAVEGASVSGPVFFGDGSALAWVENVPDDMTLQVIGWTDDGPGSGERATDNAGFGLEPQGEEAGRALVLHEWLGPYTSEGAEDAGAVLGAISATFDEPTSGPRYVPLERQADGAWGMQSVGAPPGGIGPDRAPQEGGATYALGGNRDGSGEPLWMVRLEDDGLVLYHDPYGDEVGRTTTRTSLPDDLMAGEGFPTLWVREVGDAALVGSANTATAYLVDLDGNVGRLEGDVAWAAPVR